MSLAYQALYLNEYGLITRLSEEHKVSREFIYQLRNQLQIWSVVIFGVSAFSLFEKSPTTKNEELITISHIVSLRLEGRCPISGIHLLLKRGGFRNTSVGYISELLNSIGSKLSSQFELPEGFSKLQVVFASDEIFSKSKPILVTLDPISSVILRMEIVENRTAEQWEEHWTHLLEEGITPILLTNDEGTAMRKAQKSVLPDTPRQSDTFHAIALRLGDIVRKLRKKVYKAIEDEYDRERVWENAKSEQVLLRRTQEYEQALFNTEGVFENYENFRFLYQCIIESLAFFDSEGNPNTPQNAKHNINIAIEYIRELDCCNQNMEKQLDTIVKLLPNLLNYLKMVQKIIESWKPLLATQPKQKAFKKLCMAYGYIKNSRKHKNHKAKRYFLHLAEEQKEQARIELQQNHPDVDIQNWWTKIYEQLEQIVQSSALVETINSILRTFLNGAKNQLNQNQLNLIMFYLNHRKYLRGKRKGFSPIELLTNEKQEQDWLDILLKEVKISA